MNNKDSAQRIDYYNFIIEKGVSPRKLSEVVFMSQNENTIGIHSENRNDVYKQPFYTLAIPAITNSARLSISVK